MTIALFPTTRVRSRSGETKKTALVSFRAPPSRATRARPDAGVLDCHGSDAPCTIELASLLPLLVLLLGGSPFCRND